MVDLKANSRQLARLRSGMAKVTLKNVYKTYPGERGKEVTAVEDFNLEITDREFVVFVGPSGCGKSNLANDCGSRRNLQGRRSH